MRCYLAGETIHVGGRWKSRLLDGPDDPSSIKSTSFWTIITIVIGCIGMRVGEQRNLSTKRLAIRTSYIIIVNGYRKIARVSKRMSSNSNAQECPNPSSKLCKQRIQ